MLIDTQTNFFMVQLIEYRGSTAKETKDGNLYHKPGSGQGVGTTYFNIPDGQHSSVRRVESISYGTMIVR